jgi:hypothetical protein
MSAASPGCPLRCRTHMQDRLFIGMWGAATGEAECTAGQQRDLGESEEVEEMRWDLRTGRLHY